MSRLSIRIGEALVDWRGCDVTVEQVADLIRQVSAVATELTSDDETETERPPLGFALAIGDKADPLPVEHFYSDDED